MDIFWQLYFPFSQLKANRLLNCIEIIESSNLAPRLEYFLTGLKMILTEGEMK